jgi:excisionase family DNA binding protein
MSMKESVTERIGFSIVEVGTMLGVSKGHVRNEILRGKLRPHRVGARLVVLKSELDRYLKSCQTESDL